MRILLFSQLKEAAGKPELEWPGVGTLTLEQFWARLLHEQPALSAYRSITRVAKNWEYASPGELFRDEDEVALIPPVSGG